jgi:hypothetical protein
MNFGHYLWPETLDLADDSTPMFFLLYNRKRD